MAQPSVVAYFTTKKRAANDELDVSRAKKLILDKNAIDSSLLPAGIDSGKLETDRISKILEPEKTPNKICSTSQDSKVRKSRASSKRITHTSKGQTSLQMFVTRTVEDNLEKHSIPNTHKKGTDFSKNTNSHEAREEVPIKDDSSLASLKQRLESNSRIDRLKASIARFSESQKRLKQIERVTSQIASPTKSPKLNSFKSVELEVDLSPQKAHTPEKSYLSPKKDTSVKKNLLNLFSPTKIILPVLEESSKHIFDLTPKSTLTLPFKYRCLAEIFRSIDTICQIMFNRKETITFRKLKPGVENMTKRNLTTHSLAQIKKIYPNAFSFRQEKLWLFINGKREEKWDLVITPIMEGNNSMTSEVLLTRRRILFNILLGKTKDYHQEFLSNLDPPMLIPREKITRWHPEFDIEKVPDIEEDQLPKPPQEFKCTSGQDVLSKACQIFKYNSRMEQALETLKTETKPPETLESSNNNSILKGIPKALLEKVRQKQAAKALLQMTRSATQEHELKIYSRLPELARLLKNLFISEKKNVLKLDTAIEKLENYYKMSLTKIDVEEHIKILVNELPDWLTLYQSLGKVWFIKQVKRDSDLKHIRMKLDALIKQKSDQFS